MSTETKVLDLEVFQKFPQPFSIYDDFQVILGAKDTHVSLKVIYAYRNDPSSPTHGFYFFPADCVLIRTNNHEHVRRFCPLHVYGDWASSKLDIHDKWAIRRATMSLHAVLPRFYWT